MLTPVELDMMKIVWRRAPAPVSVRDVQIALRPHRVLAYTTVMTVMARLYRKGALHRSKKSRMHVYQPAITFADARDKALTAVVDGYFSGSRDQLQVFLEDGDTPAVPPRPPGLMAPAIDDSLL